VIYKRDPIVYIEPQLSPGAHIRGGGGGGGGGGGVGKIL
jgi:hypothetical protein